MRKRQFKRILVLVMTLAFTFTVFAVPASAKSNDKSLKVSVLSDVHLLPSDLIADSTKYRETLKKDQKHFNESEAILKQELKRVKKEKPDVLLVSGDLSKDGELESHKLLAQYLKGLKKELPKLKIYVINGNHDIRNSNAYNYAKNKPATRTEPSDFKKIYNITYGDKTIIATFKPEKGEANQLSYVAHPKKGFTVVAVDSGCYSSDNTKSGQTEHETRGNINPECRAWVVKQIAKAKKRGDTIIGLVHHGINAHFTVQPKILKDFLVDNHEEVATEWADAGMKYVFTGHMHQQDVAEYKTANGNKLYDIATGSTISYPSATRLVTFIRGNNKEVVKGKVFDNNSLKYINPQTGKKTFIKNLTKKTYDSLYGINTSLVMSLASDFLMNKLGYVSPTIATYLNNMVNEFFDTELLDGYDNKRFINYVYFTSMGGYDHGDNPDWYYRYIEKVSSGQMADLLESLLTKYLNELGSGIIKNIVDSIMPGLSSYLNFTPIKVVIGPRAKSALTSFVLEICDSMTNDQNFIYDNAFTIK